VPATDASATGTYLFLCAACGRFVSNSQPCEPCTARRHGAGRRSAENLDARTDARPLTPDDLLDSHQLLATADRLAPLLLDAKLVRRSAGLARRRPVRLTASPDIRGARRCCRTRRSRSAEDGPRTADCPARCEAPTPRRPQKEEK
jgi:hypothetical protein